MVDIVSKNGALLLNIGPKPDGTIPAEEERMLREIGAWLRPNGEAIYDTRPWKIFGEGPTEVTEGSFTDTKRQAFTGADLRFTTKDDTLYAIALEWSGTILTVRSLSRNTGLYEGKISTVTLLGHNALLPFEHTADALTVSLPEQPPGNHAFAFKITHR